MRHKWENQVEELLKEGVIDPSTAEKINSYFIKKTGDSPGSQMVVFAILGSLLIGLGIILIVAHNWDNLNRTLKSFLAFLPLVAGQLACFYALYKKYDHAGWKEGSATFLFLALGASIALIGQIYNLPGSMSSFLLTWMLLAFPLIYLLNSSAGALLFMAGITAYACELGYWQSKEVIPFWYWLMLAATTPHYILLLKKSPEGHFTNILNWAMPLSIIITLGTWASTEEELMFIGYISFFSLLYLIGRYYIKSSRDLFNSFQVYGSLGLLIMLLIFSFNSNWEEFFKDYYREGLTTSPELVISTVLIVTAFIVILKNELLKNKMNYNLTGYGFIIFLLSFGVAFYSSLLATIVINIFLLAQGILLIRTGSVKNHLGILNYGLVIITTLVFCRFFDVQISFVMRGMLFLGIGFAFFLFNYRTLKNRKA